jgi:alcohol dehydrogenase class IV
MDALCQLIEGYVSKGANAMTDALAAEGLRTARVAMPLYGRNEEGWEGMATAAMLSGMVLTNAGLGAVHGLAAPLGAMFPVPHGAACAALLAGVMQANIAAARKEGAVAVLTKYGMVAKFLAGRGEAEVGVEFVLKLCAELGVERLGKFGVTESAVGEVVALAMKASSMRFNPVPLDEETLARLLRAAI